MERRGSQPGERRGGRKPGVPNKANADIKALAQEYGPKALAKLAKLMESSEQEVALKAANSLLDRGYGRPAQAIVGDPDKPLEYNICVIDEFTRRIASMGGKTDEDQRN